MGGKGKASHKSIYIPPELGAKLEAHKAAGYDINFSRVCRAAIDKALDETDDEGVSVGSVMKQLRDREEEIRQLKAVLQGLVRHAASHCGMTVLSEKDEKAFKDVFENGVESFIYQAKKQALEEYKATQKRKRKQKKKIVENKASRLIIEEIETRPVTTHTGEAREETVDLPPSLNAPCSVCSEKTGDVPCEGDDCSNMVCWYCWGEMDDPKLCPECQNKGQQEQ